MCIGTVPLEQCESAEWLYSVNVRPPSRTTPAGCRKRIVEPACSPGHFTGHGGLLPAGWRHGVPLEAVLRVSGGGPILVRGALQVLLMGKAI